MIHSLPCTLIKDILPQYIDGKTSTETNDLIEEHLKYCSNCCACLQTLQNNQNEKISAVTFKANEPDEQEEEARRYLVIAQKIKRRKIITALSTAILFVLTLIIILQTFTPVLVSGHSMSPAMEDGKITLLNKIAYTFNAPKRYDVIAYQRDGSQYVSRIIAVPGEKVCLAEGILYVDGAALSHGSLSSLPLDQIWELPITTAGQYAVIKDNDPNAMPLLIDTADIIGRFRVEQ